MAKRERPQSNMTKMLNILIFMAVIAIIVCVCLIIYTIFNKTRKDQKLADGKTLEIDSVKNEVEIPDDVTIKLSVIGDIMCHNTQYMDAYVDGIYDFSYVFDDIREKLSSSDFTVGNLETTFAGSDVGYSNYPNFNTPESLGIALKEAGVDLVSTANNHSLDTGYNGIESTINFLDQYGILHTGTYKSQEAQNTTTIAEIKGLRVAFLSFSYGTNDNKIPEGREYCINLIDDNFIIDRLNLAKQQNPDIICVFMHWGEEYETTPNSEQIRLANLLFDNGVNVILGSHPHVLQRMENTEKGFVIYSLGNFMSGQVYENTRDSIILDLTITKKGTGEVVVESGKYTPIYTYRSSASKRKFKILDIKKALDQFDLGNKYISESDYNLLKREYEKINSLVDPEF